MYYEEETVIEGVTNGTYTLTLDLSKAEEGLVGVSIEVTTSSGRIDSYAYELYIDKRPPVIQFIEPKNYTLVSGVFNVSLLIFDFYYDLPEDGVWFNITGANYKVYVDPPYYTLEIDARNSTGLIHVEIYVKDYVGHLTKMHLVYYVDNTPPVSTIELPRYWWNTTVVLEINATDDISGVAKTYYRVDHGEWVEGTTITIPAPSDHSNDGIHFIEYYSVDYAGNVEPVKNLSLGIDTVQPIINIDSPLNNSMVPKIIYVTGNVSDELSGINNTIIKVDGIVYSMSSDQLFNISIDTHTLTDGIHIFSIKAIDQTGKTTIQNITLNIISRETPTPTITPSTIPTSTSISTPATSPQTTPTVTQPTGGIDIVITTIIIVIVVVVVAAIFIFLRK